MAVSVHQCPRQLAEVSLESGPVNFGKACVETRLHVAVPGDGRSACFDGRLEIRPRVGSHHFRGLPLRPAFALHPRGTTQPLVTKQHLVAPEARVQAGVRGERLRSHLHRCQSSRAAHELVECGFCEPPIIWVASSKEDAAGHGARYALHEHLLGSRGHVTVRVVGVRHEACQLRGQKREEFPLARGAEGDGGSLAARCRPLEHEFSRRLAVSHDEVHAAKVAAQPTHLVQRPDSSGRDRLPEQIA
mmetsp:Transcript_19436/g.52285  ORF Transcript_19436/g.52285 Transcript_19436/m.52285 type:complete len:246 (-) Transcript_19436:247-984(-)